MSGLQCQHPDLPHGQPLFVVYHQDCQTVYHLYTICRGCKLVCVQDAVDRGWLYASHASHFTGVTGMRKLLLTALELANAMTYLHSVDIMHGQLTGGNVLLHSSPVTAGDTTGFTVKVRACHHTGIIAGAVAVVRHGACLLHCQAIRPTAVDMHRTCLIAQL